MGLSTTKVGTNMRLTDIVTHTGLLVGVREGDVGAQDRAQALLQHRVVLEDAVADHAPDELREAGKGLVLKSINLFK